MPRDTFRSEPAHVMSRIERQSLPGDLSLVEFMSGESELTERVVGWMLANAVEQPAGELALKPEVAEWVELLDLHMLREQRREDSLDEGEQLVYGADVVNLLQGLKAVDRAQIQKDLHPIIVELVVGAWNEAVEAVEHLREMRSFEDLTKGSVVQGEIESIERRAMMGGSADEVRFLDSDTVMRSALDVAEKTNDWAPAFHRVQAWGFAMEVWAAREKQGFKTPEDIEQRFGEALMKVEDGNGVTPAMLRGLFLATERRVAGIGSAQYRRYLNGVAAFEYYNPDDLFSILAYRDLLTTEALKEPTIMLVELRPGSEGDELDYGDRVPYTLVILPQGCAPTDPSEREAMEIGRPVERASDTANPGRLGKVPLAGWVGMTMQFTHEVIQWSEDGIPLALKELARPRKFFSGLEVPLSLVKYVEREEGGGGNKLLVPNSTALKLAMRALSDYWQAITDGRMEAPDDEGRMLEMMRGFVERRMWGTTDISLGMKKQMPAKVFYNGEVEHTIGQFMAKYGSYPQHQRRLREFFSEGKWDREGLTKWLAEQVVEDALRMMIGRDEQGYFVRERGEVQEFLAREVLPYLPMFELVYNDAQKHMVKLMAPRPVGGKGLYADNLVRTGSVVGRLEQRLMTTQHKRKKTV